MIPLALVAVAGIAFAAMGLTHAPNLQRIATGLGFPLAYVQSASKWAKRRGLALDWVLATIIVESRGIPSAAGDADGRSAGLMQVNTVAHAAEMAAAGVTRAQMFVPETNIEWGTKYLAQFKADVLKALGGRRPPIPLDQIVRLSYKGPATVLAALRRGENPGDISWAPAAIANWQSAINRVRALTNGALRA